MGTNSTKGRCLTYFSTKTFEHAFSCAFRQWKATSHCNKIHGYALTVKLIFKTEELDHRNWAVDFGGLKDLKKELEETFDHTTVIAEDDPFLERFEELARLKALELVVLPAVGCEKFAEHIAGMTKRWLMNNFLYPRVKLHSVEVSEHGANSALWQE